MPPPAKDKQDKRDKTKIGPKIIIYDVPTGLTTKSFMAGMYERNLRDIISEAEMMNGVRVVSRGGKKDSTNENVIVELPGKAWKHLVNEGRIRMKILQLNCQRSYECMLDLAECMVREKMDIAILQEPYTWEGHVRGIPHDMRVIEGQGRVKAAVVVNGNIDAVGVDELDANAVSPMWHSKVVSRSRENEERGRIIEEYVLERGMDVLNEASEFYTFCTVNGMSDIDVSLLSGGNVSGT
ncbi:hypothetical protein CBL_12099 [Carabus blaptoides fortunei]